MYVEKKITMFKCFQIRQNLNKLYPRHDNCHTDSAKQFFFKTKYKKLDLNVFKLVNLQLY
jgi:hypothetical protein